MVLFDCTPGLVVLLGCMLACVIVVLGLGVVHVLFVVIDVMLLPHAPLALVVGWSPPFMIRFLSVPLCSTYDCVNPPQVDSGYECTLPSSTFAGHSCCICNSDAVYTLVFGNTSLGASRTRLVQAFHHFYALTSALPDKKKRLSPPR